MKRKKLKRGPKKRATPKTSPIPATQALATLPSPVELALIQGDLSSLSPDERVSYYRAVCRSLGLNPLTRPFEYLTLNNKLQLYARRDCADQLRQSRNVRIEILERAELNGLALVRVRASMPNGRTDESIGAVVIKGQSGLELANSIMKAETKAKRRATLSICGLGMLDETEIGDLKEGQFPALAGAPPLRPEDVMPRRKPPEGEGVVAGVIPPPEKPIQPAARSHGEGVIPQPDDASGQTRETGKKAEGIGKGVEAPSSPSPQASEVHRFVTERITSKLVTCLKCRSKDEYPIGRNPCTNGCGTMIVVKPSGAIEYEQPVIPAEVQTAQSALPLAPPDGTVIEISGRQLATGGITKETLLKAYKLGSQLDALTKPGTAKEILGRDYGLEHRHELSEQTGQQYVAQLAKRVNQELARR